MSPESAESRHYEKPRPSPVRTSSSSGNILSKQPFCREWAPSRRATEKLATFHNLSLNVPKLAGSSTQAPEIRFQRSDSRGQIPDS